MLRISLKLTTLAAYVSLAVACSNRPAPTDIPEVESGEPQQYSATIVHSIDDGVERELSVIRVSKSGDLRREEWVEQDASRAMIWRPDTGKSYLLDLDKGRYVETDIPPSDMEKTSNLSTNSKGLSSKEQPLGKGSKRANPRALDVETIERAFGDAPSPSRVETRLLADQTIDGHPCKVSERRAVFTDDEVEVTTTFRAGDLNGLAIRVETGSTKTRVKLITRWLNIRTEAPAEVFLIRGDFKKVESLSR